MRPGVTPHQVSYSPFQYGHRSLFDWAVTDETISGISKDGKLLWLSKGSVIDVIKISTKQCVTSWKFGDVLKDKHSYITCVKDYSYGRGQRLLVGVCSSQQSSMVCVLDLQTARVTKVMEIPHKVSSIETVTNVGGDYIPIWALNDQLRMFHGIIAVGTISGIVYLIDMCIDQEFYSDEVTPSKLQYITPRSRDTEERRKQALLKGHHLCLVLDEESHGNQYEFRRCDGTILKTFNKDEVTVSCMKYIPQIGTLVVGFSFGSYQLWKLNVPVLEYSSRVEVDSALILYIAYQEPENDPKNFCYLWFVRGGETNEEETVSSAALYQLAYNKKTWYSNYGAFFEELTSVSLRFEIDLTSNLFNTVSKTTISRAITCYTLEDPNYSPPSRLNEEESFEESIHGPDLSRCLFVWESTEGNNKTHQMALFDMNRWYHAQMPGTLRCIVGNLDTCPYLSVHCLDEAVDTTEALLAVHICTDSIRKFINTSPLPPDQHFYPASLTFDALLVFESGSTKVNFLGTQRQVLTYIEKLGPCVLLNCKDLYHQCIYFGLLPRPLDAARHNPTATQMRESMLTMALEYNLVTFVCKCIEDWSPGEYVHLGCTLKFLLDWAWSRVVHEKNVIDNTCTPLYDWSGTVLDSRSMQTLEHAYRKLSNLTVIFGGLLNLSSPTTEEGAVQLANKLTAIEYLCQHLQSVLWFIGAGLLPEHDEVEEYLHAGQYCYPASSLIHAYRLRRQELQKLNRDIGETEILLIDGLLSDIGPAVMELWQNEGGNGLYPPPSLNALLCVYLIDSIDLMMKHCIVLYGLLDLVSVADQKQHEQLSEKISDFTQAMGMPVSVIKQIQGFWLLDHKDFDESVLVMLNSMTKGDLGNWQHSRIVKSLLYQGESKLALKYVSSKQVPLSTPEEVKLKLTVLITNGLPGDALQYIRTCRDQDNLKDLFNHLFLGCQQTKTMDKLLQLSFSDEEDSYLTEYLSDSNEPNSKELLVGHYLLRARYVEAIQLNERLKHAIVTDFSSKARARTAKRNALIEGYLSILPAAQRKHVLENRSVQKKTVAKRIEVKKPEPLSTTVNTNRSQMRSKSSIFLEIFERMEGIQYEEQEDPNKEPATPAQPFACTPITPRATSVFGFTQPVVYMTQPDSSLRKSIPGHPSETMSFDLTKFKSPLFPNIPGRICCAAALSVLKTPVTLRKSLSRSRTSSSVPATPQSILKVRRLISNTSPEVSPSQSMTKVSEETPLPGTSLSVSFKNVSVQGTPKQLRFMDAKSEVSKPLPPGQKSVKDRSPTPESISMSPKYKANLDRLQRPPLHDEQQHPNEKSMADGNYSMDDDAMEKDVQVVDEEITFNFTRNADSGDESLNDSSEEVNKQPGTVEKENEPISMSQILRKSALKTTPVKLRHSPMKTNIPPRSPTVKLTKSPARGMIPATFVLPDDGEQSRQTKDIPDFGQPINIPVAVERDQPIEIDDSEEDIEEEQTKKERSVSFGVITEKEEESDDVKVSSVSEDDDEDLEEKIRVIENRILEIVQQTPVEKVAEKKTDYKRPKCLDRKYVGKIKFNLFGSSSDKVSSTDNAPDVGEQSRQPKNIPDFGQPINIPVQSDQPIEMDDSEEDIKEEQTKKERSVSFGVITEKGGESEDVKESSASEEDNVEDLEEKIRVIENRIIEEAQRVSPVMKLEQKNIDYKRPKCLYRKRVGKKIQFNLPDSSSDQVSSTEVVVQGSCEGEKFNENAKENVTTTEDNERLQLEIMDDSEKLQLEISEDEDENFKQNEVSSQTNSEAALARDFSKFVDSLTKGIEEKEKSTLNEKMLEENQKGESLQEIASTEQQEVLEGKEHEDDGLPPTMEIDEDCFDNKLPPLFENEEKVSENVTGRRSLTRRSSALEKSMEQNLCRSSRRLSQAKLDVQDISESSDNEPRRSSRRLSLRARSEDTEIVSSVQKSPGRKSKLRNDSENETRKSPPRGCQGSKSPGQRKKVQDDSQTKALNTCISPERVKSPGRKTKVSRKPTLLQTDLPVTPRSLRSKNRSTASPQFKDDDSGMSTPQKSRDSSPNIDRDRKSITPTRSRRSRQSLTPTRRSKRLEEQTPTPEISETESDVIAPVFSFSDPKQVDIPNNDFTKVKEMSEVQSFIFSPPAQPRTRRSLKDADVTYSGVTLQEFSILLPSVSRETTPVRSREGTPVKSAGRSKQKKLDAFVPAPIPEVPTGIPTEKLEPVRSREGTPVKSTPRGRRRKDTKSDISIQPIPEEPPGMSTEESDAAQESEPPAKKQTKRGKKKLMNYDEVNLISPIIEEDEGDVDFGPLTRPPLTRLRSKREQEMPIMNLRGTTKIGYTYLPKKKRVAKLW